MSHPRSASFKTLESHTNDVNGNPHAVTAALAGAISQDAMKSPDFPAAAADTNVWYFSPPFDSAQVQSINVGSIGTKPTAGTVAFKKGIAAGGNTLLNAATYALSGLTDNAISSMALTGTDADLQGDETTGFIMEVVNADSPIFATVTWGPQ